ncbi:hypothetical protein [Neomegalonema sp.]|uniref:hypothetical protein n=1 Tax=Neomegalonema sp. TaxID=2039713 RepID=UPI00261DF247|nr:hypothetical protein [Neomegalonema sp.]MDD2869297.1 hypothetical protein [Neomegalonema sp.]
MSGPKVVRIVTREEIMEICRGLIARVDAALEDWIRIGTRNGLLDAAEIAAARGHRDALAEALARGRFEDLQKQAPAEEAFLREDIQRRLAQAAAEEAAARSKARREREAAATLLKALRKAGAPLAADLEAGLERGDPAAVGRGLLLLGGAAPSPKTDAGLAARLREGETPPAAFTDRAADGTRAQPVEPGDPEIERIAARIAQIRRIGQPETPTPWSARLDEAEAAPPERRRLILDALEVETGRALAAARRRAAALSELRAARAEAEALGLATEVRTENPEALEIEAMEARRAETIAAVQALRASRAAEARRAAVLAGLGALGYEVSENMSTSWASEGRLVLRSALRPDYGVEVSGGDRLQMRPVAFDRNGRGPDPSRDQDAETLWCGDVEGLEKRLSSFGDALRIERGLPVGAVPLKRIEIGDPGRADEAEAPAPSRTKSRP